MLNYPHFNFQFILPSAVAVNLETLDPPHMDGLEALMEVRIYY